MTATRRVGFFLGIRAVFLHDPGISLEGTSLSSTVCTSSEGSQEQHKHGKVSPAPGGTLVTSCESWPLEYWNFSSSSAAWHSWRAAQGVAPPPALLSWAKSFFEWEAQRDEYPLSSTNLAPAILECHKTPALKKVRKELKSKGSHNWRKFQTWLTSVLCLWCTFPPDTTLWHCAAFVSVWEKLLKYVLNIVQIWGIRAINHPIFYWLGRWWNHRATSHFLRQLRGLHFSLHSTWEFLFITKLCKYRFPFLCLNVFCKGGSLSQFRVWLGQRSCPYHTGHKWDIPVM